MRPKVTVICTAYNQKNYIRQALDGFIMQKTNFKFEVVVHDDASTDGTDQIIKEYQKKYPDIIKPIFQKTNQFSQEKDILIDCIIDFINSEYVAMNEGDDYWIDENKLQRQVDFLDTYPEFTICFHPVKVIWEDNSKPERIFPTAKKRFYKNVLELNDLLKSNFIQTNSVMYRWKLTKEQWPQKHILPCDHLWHLLHANYGKIGFIPQIMSVYRRNKGGIWDGCGQSDSWFCKCGIPNMRFFKTMEQLFNVDRSKNILHMAQSTIPALLKNKQFAKLQNMSEEFSDEWIRFFDMPNHKMLRSMNKIKRKYHFYQLLSIVLLLISIYLFLR